MKNCLIATVAFLLTANCMGGPKGDPDEIDRSNRPSPTTHSLQIVTVEQGSGGKKRIDASCNVKGPNINKTVTTPAVLAFHNFAKKPKDLVINCKSGSSSTEVIVVAFYKDDGENGKWWQYPYSVFVDL